MVYHPDILFCISKIHCLKQTKLIEVYSQFMLLKLQFNYYWLIDKGRRIDICLRIKNNISNNIYNSFLKLAK